jgi:hypothetical protein
MLDVGDLRNMDASSVDFKELIIRLTQFISNMATVVNLKETAIYDTNEFKTNKMYFPDAGLTSQSSKTPIRRESARTVVVFPSLASATLNQMPHNIPFNSAYTATVVSAAATDTTNLRYYPLPWAAVTGGSDASLNYNISLWVDGTNVNIHNNTHARATCSAIVVIEYLKF